MFSSRPASLNEPHRPTAKNTESARSGGNLPIFKTSHLINEFKTLVHKNISPSS